MKYEPIPPYKITNPIYTMLLLPVPERAMGEKWPFRHRKSLFILVQMKI